MTIAAGTGHRPDKLGGYNDTTRYRLVDLAIAALRRYEVEKVVSGAALGWDTALALAALNLGLPLLVAVPFKGQEMRWKEADQKRYNDILSDAREVVYVCDPGYAAWKMQRRNEWMVDRCQLLLALWDGSNGGTKNCLDYAKTKDVEVRNLWSSWVEHK